MKILWYNVWTYPFLTSNNHVNRVVDYVLRAVEDHQIDVVVLGELFDRSIREVFKQQLRRGLHGWKVVPRGEETDWPGQQPGGLLAMYRESGFSLIDSRYHILSDGVMQDSLAAKGVMGLRFTNDHGTPLWVCATHLQDPDAGFPGLCKGNTQRQFSEVLAVTGMNGPGWAKHEDAVIFGDFNLSPADSAHAWANARTTLLLLHPMEATHATTAETLDYGVTSCSPERNVEIGLVDDHRNPSDHRAICLSVPDFGRPIPARVTQVPHLRPELSSILLIALAVCWTWKWVFT
tara:strand:+ start:2776 stop:3648 length:873 start_codon:yes stop_codon:yes gene_type:complete